jgi:hypothetical protein
MTINTLLRDPECSIEKNFFLYLIKKGRENSKQLSVDMYGTVWGNLFL